MSFMGKIAKLDSAMQRGLDNSFAYVFGGQSPSPSKAMIRFAPGKDAQIVQSAIHQNMVVGF